ncbi:4-hydroxythreonine-4-phosphate dehydrogenase [Leptolyngbya sp. Heron Island J]|uniref:4-hydroxythreonine-4-phosphate dehydrogenase PdxA n=1 Tax=Leptolyngbya sp. Heron Island J TaxID=1385935 RepID=UPI0003B9B171|nr:4-hydroxythreonine-4-phosphate dehydrogenase PdxA [Leptolyngbya sp. Heron Island J]ESA37213.1 4-hydroxythreonine-4-phosphate dehydrogenase [Leptolyngbya sp. Heron Island J]
MNVAKTPKLLITLGDMAGIGPEVVLKALPLVEPTAELTLVGNQHQLIAISQQLNLPLADYPIIDVPLAAEQTLCLGQGDAASGDLSFRSLQTAIHYCLKDGYDGVVTAPIAKSAWLAAGHHYPGQTELLAEMADVKRFGMLFVAKSPLTQWTLRTLLATTHIPLRQVPEALTPELMTLKLELLLTCLEQDFGIEQPQVAIAGLNPHSGEQGQLGREEIDWLIPWINTQRQRFPHVTIDGPVPPDTLWVSPAQAWQNPQHQAHHGYIALYHDQGLIPVKMLGFDQAVNTTIGLPFIRTSPDHGTAFDIAGQGIARPDSMLAAINLAIDLATQRHLN